MLWVPAGVRPSGLHGPSSLANDDCIGNSTVIILRISPRPLQIQKGTSRRQRCSASMQPSLHHQQNLHQKGRSSDAVGTAAEAPVDALSAAGLTRSRRSPERSDSGSGGERSETGCSYVSHCDFITSNVLCLFKVASSE